MTDKELQRAIDQGLAAYEAARLAHDVWYDTKDLVTKSKYIAALERRDRAALVLLKAICSAVQGGKRVTLE